MSAIGARLDLRAPAPPWAHDPSAWRQRLPICALAFVAFLLSSWMALYQWRLAGPPWDPLFGAGTATVLDSQVSEGMRRWLGIPDAALGAIAYLGDVLFGLAGSTRRWQTRPWLVVLFGLDVIPLGAVSVVLVVLQGAVVGAWCGPCLLTAAISIALIVWAYDEVWSSLRWLRHVWRETRSRRAVWDALWGTPPAGVDPLAYGRSS